jgi:hypothetical protein
VRGGFGAERCGSGAVPSGGCGAVRFDPRLLAGADRKIFDMF